MKLNRWTSRHSIDTDLDADSFTIAPALASADAVSRPRNENENGTSKFPTTSSAKKVGLDGASGFPIDVTVPLKPPTKASRRNSAEMGRPRGGTPFLSSQSPAARLPRCAARTFLGAREPRGVCAIARCFEISSFIASTPPSGDSFETVQRNESAPKVAPI